MARPTDPTFGSDFDADLFRSAITSTMEMGLPSNESDRATFRWTPQYNYAIADPEGNPYDFAGAPETTLDKPDVQVPVSVDFQTGSPVPIGTSLGNVNEVDAVITILDIHFALVTDADQVILGGNTYNINYIAPPLGLFDVTVYNIYLTAVDET